MQIVITKELIYSNGFFFVFGRAKLLKGFDKFTHKLCENKLALEAIVM